MLISINAFLEIITIVIGTFLIERYVLLEPPMEAKKQRIFYIFCFCSITAVFFIGGDIAKYVALFLGGFNIFLGRKRHHIIGFLMVIPIAGVINGVASLLFIATTVMQVIYGLDIYDDRVQLALLAVYLIYAVLLAVFYVKGRGWRKWFDENMKDRSPSRSEQIVVVISGIVIFMFRAFCGNVTANLDTYSEDAIKIIGMLIIFCTCLSFLTTLTIIVLVMQGNKRKFYHDKVSGMQFSIIATMADIVENRDPNTGGHIKRTAKYVEIIGKNLLKSGKFSDILTQQYLDDMVVAAPLHDIGKISVSDAILNKPGRLTDEEFEKMKLHASAGRDVLKNAEKQLGGFDYLEIAMDMAEYHHEWFDGKGYPKGIKGEEIPLCARIMAVADVFDALTSKRCYKDAMPLEKAYHIISDETGTHFDPTIAKAFLDSRKEIEKAMEELSDNGENIKLSDA